MKDIKLDNLAESLITEIKNREDFFNDFIIVTPTRKIEKWFKAFWLKREEDVLMNVKFMNTNEALCDLIEPKSNLTIISDYLLLFFIMEYLSNNKINLPDNIKKYLFKVNGEIDSIKLYGFSKQLTMLFRKYEDNVFTPKDWQLDLYNNVLEFLIKNHYTTIGYLANNNLKIKQNDKKYHFFGFTSFTKLEENIINEAKKLNDINIYELDSKESIESKINIVTAPSRTREIEFVHSKICSLLKEKDTKLSDFLVVSPVMDEYLHIIPSVFTQDNINFPSIPYSISSKNLVDNDITSALEIFNNIHLKGFFTRHDLFSLLNNKTVSKTRNISKEEIETYQDTIFSLKVYRNAKSRDDWEYIKNRLLISKIVSVNDDGENIIELESGKTIPYENISLSDESIIKLISIIDDLKNILSLYDQIKVINNESINLLKEEYDKWFSYELKEELNKEYRHLLKSFAPLIKLNLESTSITFDCFIYYLIDASKKMNSTNGEIFTSGVTFTDFNELEVLSNKYVFFLGASSKNIPLKIKKSELDESNIIIDNQEASFNAICNNANKELYISYVNKDLATDEDFYPSTFVKQIMDKYEGIYKSINIDLDETRPWEELFTKREFKNKGYFLNLLKDSKKEVDLDNGLIQDKENTKYLLSDFSSFLKEPLELKAKHAFGYEFDNSQEEEREFENLFINNIDRSKVFKSLALEILKNNKLLNDVESLNKYKESLFLTHQLLDIEEKYNDDQFDIIFNLALDNVNFVLDSYKDKYELFKVEDLSFNVEKEKMVLCMNHEFVLLDKEGNKRNIFGIRRFNKKIEDIKLDQYIDIYIASLMLIASYNDSNTYEVTLTLQLDASKTFSITPQRAQELLVNIYKLLTDKNRNIFFNLNEENGYSSLSDLIDALNGIYNNPWGYYTDKKLFDYQTELGFNEDNFCYVYEKNRLDMIDLIEFVDPEIVIKEAKDLIPLFKKINAFIDSIKPNTMEISLLKKDKNNFNIYQIMLKWGDKQIPITYKVVEGKDLDNIKVTEYEKFIFEVLRNGRELKSFEEKLSETYKQQLIKQSNTFKNLINTFNLISESKTNFKYEKKEAK